jgi:hypothetical protein
MAGFMVNKQQVTILIDASQKKMPVDWIEDSF